MSTIMTEVCYIVLTNYIIYKRSVLKDIFHNKIFSKLRFKNHFTKKNIEIKKESKNYHTIIKDEREAVKISGI